MSERLLEFVAALPSDLAGHDPHHLAAAAQGLGTPLGLRFEWDGHAPRSERLADVLRERLAGRRTPLATAAQAAAVPALLNEPPAVVAALAALMHLEPWLTHTSHETLLKAGHAPDALARAGDLAGSSEA